MLSWKALGVILLEILVISSVVAADDRFSMSKDLNQFILQSGPKSGTTISNQKRGVSQKLDWFSDVVTERSDIFVNHGNYDSPADNPDYGRRMLRRAIGKQASEIARESELRKVYNDMSEFFKSAQNMLTYREDMGTPIANISNSPGKKIGRKIVSFGLDSSNQFSPTVTIYENLKLSYEPLSDRLLTEIGWDF